MEHRVSSQELLEKLGEILSRVRDRGDSFVVERDGDPVARIVPLGEKAAVSLREAFTAWRGVGAPEPGFADDLERVGAADRAPANPWAS